MNAFRWLFRAFFARIGWVAAGLLLVLLGFDVKADPACPAGQTHRWTLTSKVTANPCALNATFPSTGAYKSACLPAHLVPFPHISGTRHSAGVWYSEASTYDGISGVFTPQVDVHPDATTHMRYTATSIGTLTHSCVAATCGVPSGTRLSALMYFSTAGNGTCVSNCVVQMNKEMEVDGLGSIYNAYSTGTNCTTGTDIPDVDPDGCVDGSGSCVNNDLDGASDGLNEDDEPSGASWEALEDHGCVTTENGSAFCIASAPDVKRPDTGVPGTVAPVTNVSNYYGDRAAPGDTVTTVHYYSSSVVNNSTNLGDGDPDGDGDDSSGECEPGDTDCEGGGRGDGRVKGKGGTAKTFASSNAMIYNAAKNSALGTAVTGVSGAFPTGGTCPVFAFTAPIIGTVSTDVHCTIFDGNVRPILASVMLAVYGIMSVLILLDRK